MGLAVLSGLLLTAAFPRIGFDWTAWFALVPLLISCQSRSLRQGFALGFTAGLTHYLTLLYWLVHTMKAYGGLPLYLSSIILLLFSAYLAIYIALFSAVAVRADRNPFFGLLMIPLLWVSLEFLRAHLFTGFPWALIGYSQYKQVALVQLADIFGVYGVSFLVAAANVALFVLWLFLRRKPRQGTKVSMRQTAALLSAWLILFLFSWSYGNWRVRSIEGEMSSSASITAAVIQGNIEQDKKWDPAFQKETVEKYLRLSLSTRRHRPDLVVWPETATPFYFLYHHRLSEMVANGVRSAETSFLIGSPSFISNRNRVEYYNSAYLIAPDGTVAGKYDKVHLVPFGEYVPFRRWLPFLGKIVAHVGDFQAGRRGNTIKGQGPRLGVQICFEIIFPMLSRALVQNDAALLVNITNDAWFGKSSAPYQHFSMAVFRAVENRRSLVRAANTGISGFVDPIGRIVASTPLDEEAALIRRVPIFQKKTFYTRYGNVFAQVCLVITFLYQAYLAYGRRRQWTN